MMRLSIDMALRGDRPTPMSKAAWARMHARSRELMVEALRATVDHDNTYQEMRHEQGISNTP